MNKQLAGLFPWLAEDLPTIREGEGDEGLKTCN